MSSNSAPSWEVSASAGSLQDSSAALMLRLGMATNSLTTAYQFTILVDQLPASPLKTVLVIHCFQLAASYLKEATRLAKNNWTTIHRLAIRGQAPKEGLARLENLVNNTDSLSATLQRIRSRLTFHWDLNEVEAWIATHDDLDVKWIEGVGQTRRNTIHSAASDVVAERILPGRREEAPGTREPRITTLSNDVLLASDATIRVFDAVVAAFLNDHGASLMERE